ncbi:MAG: transposase [Pseudomonadota bacterium]
MKRTGTEGGHSCPPGKEYGGLENPPSCFLNPEAPIEQHQHRLPHWQQGEVFCFVTWRLADSLPTERLKEWKAKREAWLCLHPEPWDEKTEEEYHERFSRQIDDWLDQGHGSCVLRDSKYAVIVADGIRHFDGERYGIVSFVVMPNHVHVLFRPCRSYRLEQIVKSWKGFTAREINRHTGKTGPLWQADYWDRLIRNPHHFVRCVQYIRENPVRAGLRSGEFIAYERETEGGHSCPPNKGAGWKTRPPSGGL